MTTIAPRTKKKASLRLGINFTGGNPSFSSCIHFAFGLSMSSPACVCVSCAFSCSKTCAVRLPRSCTDGVRSIFKVDFDRFGSTLGTKRVRFTLTSPTARR